MAIKTTYKCDRCGDEKAVDGTKTDGIQYWNIALAIAHVPKYPGPYDAQKNNKAMWCRRCVEDIGLLPFDRERIEAKEQQPVPMSLDQQLGEVVRTIVRESLQGV